MPQFLHSAIHKQSGGFSGDQGERAILEYRFVTHGLKGNLSTSCRQEQHWKITDVPSCSYRWLLDVGPLALSQT